MNVVLPSIGVRVPTRSAARLSASNIPNMTLYVDVANELADAARQVTSKYFRKPLPVDLKRDASPVTMADKEAEQSMRAILQERLPDHAIFGEEFGLMEPVVKGGSGCDFVWILDPIDGTKSFITGKPLFGTLIALCYQGRPIIGVIDQPILQERWVGAEGRPTTYNGGFCKTRQCAGLSHAALYATTPDMFQGPTSEAHQRLASKVRMSLYGCDCYAYGLVAMGQVDLVAEADMKPYDYMALVPVVEGAGGRMTDWEGGDLVWQPQGGRVEGFPEQVLAAGSEALHEQALDALDWEP